MCSGKIKYKNKSHVKYFIKSKILRINKLSFLILINLMQTYIQEIIPAVNVMFNYKVSHATLSVF